MVANITSGSNLYGALLYNMEKVGHAQAHIVAENRIFDDPATGQPDMQSCMKSFQLYLTANRNTKDTVFHVSLNPDPKDNLTDEQFAAVAREYMQRMGYGDQPYIVFSHQDIFRKHYHIVSVRVDENGKKIDDGNEWRRSMTILRDLEHKYRLVPSVKGQKLSDLASAKKVEYGHENLKQQISSVVRLLTQQYKFGSFPELNALLNLYNVGLEERKGEHQGQRYHGLVYSALNDKGEPVGVPIKSSRIGKDVGFERLEKKRLSDLEKYIGSAELKSHTRNEVIRAMHESRTKGEFTDCLKRRGIDALFRENASSGRIYGVTFIDHNTKMVLNGSRLGKNYSANVFQELFNNPRADRAALLPKLPQERNAQTPKTVQSPEQKTQTPKIVPALRADPPQGKTPVQRQTIPQSEAPRSMENAPQRATAPDDPVSSLLGALDFVAVGLENEPLPPDELDEIRENLARKYRRKKKKGHTMQR